MPGESRQGKMLTFVFECLCNWWITVLKILNAGYYIKMYSFTLPVYINNVINLSPPVKPCMPVCLFIDNFFEAAV